MAKTTVYKYGAEKERKILKQFGAQYGFKTLKEANDSGKIVLARSAGSHSPIDAFVIEPELQKITLIQSKATKRLHGDIDPKLKQKLEKQLHWLEGIYTVRFLAL